MNCQGTRVVAESAWKGVSPAATSCSTSSSSELPGIPPPGLSVPANNGTPAFDSANVNFFRTASSGTKRSEALVGRSSNHSPRISGGRKEMSGSARRLSNDFGSEVLWVRAAKNERFGVTYAPQCFVNSTAGAIFDSSGLWSKYVL